MTYSKCALNVWMENDVYGMYWFLPETGSPERLMMYYVSDGVFGSLNCVLSGSHFEHPKPYLHRVSLNNLMMYDHCV